MAKAVFFKTPRVAEGVFAIGERVYCYLNNLAGKVVDIREMQTRVAYIVKFPDGTHLSARLADLEPVRR